MKGTAHRREAEEDNTAAESVRPQLSLVAAGVKTSLGGEQEQDVPSMRDTDSRVCHGVLARKGRLKGRSDRSEGSVERRGCASEERRGPHPGPPSTRPRFPLLGSFQSVRSRHSRSPRRAESPQYLVIGRDGSTEEVAVEVGDKEEGGAPEASASNSFPNPEVRRAHDRLRRRWLGDGRGEEG